jgi:hypothetical protein
VTGKVTVPGNGFSLEEIIHAQISRLRAG